MVLEQIDPPQGRTAFGQLNTFGRYSIPWVLPPQGLDLEDTAFPDEMLFLDDDGMQFLDTDPMLFLDGAAQPLPLQTHTDDDITDHLLEPITTHG